MLSFDSLYGEFYDIDEGISIRSEKLETNVNI